MLYIFYLKWFHDSFIFLRNLGDTFLNIIICGEIFLFYMLTFHLFLRCNIILSYLLLPTCSFYRSKFNFQLKLIRTIIWVRMFNILKIQPIFIIRKNLILSCSILFFIYKQFLFFGIHFKQFFHSCKETETKRFNSANHCQV